MARALVEVVSNQIPVHRLTTRTEPVILYAGSEIATLEQVEDPVAAITTSASECESSPIKERMQEMLLNLVQDAGNDLSRRRGKNFLNVLSSNADVSATSLSDLGRTARLKHSINTGDTPPIRQVVRRLPPQRRGEARGLLKEMLEKGIIERSTSPWTAPTVLVLKKDGTVRFCVDYRKLNSATRKDVYPLPRIDATLDALAGSLVQHHRPPEWILACRDGGERP